MINSVYETVPATSDILERLGLLKLIIYVYDQPKQKKCKAFGYADDFELVSSQPSSIRKDLLKNEKLCSNKKWIRMNVKVIHSQ